MTLRRVGLPNRRDIGIVGGMARRQRVHFPITRRAVRDDLRSQLEAARLDLRALYRALDRMFLAQHLPAELRRLQELDADFAEALWVLDRPPGRFDVPAMTKDTLASLSQLAAAREAFVGRFDGPTRALIHDESRAMRGMLSPEDAYLEIPGRDPAAR